MDQATAEDVARKPRVLRVSGTKPGRQVLQPHHRETLDPRPGLPVDTGLRRYGFAGAVHPRRKRFVFFEQIKEGYDLSMGWRGAGVGSDSSHMRRKSDQNLRWILGLPLVAFGRGVLGCRGR